MRLIDADALLDEICDLMHKYENVNFGYSVIMAIHNTPTIDPNELDLDIDYSIEYDKRPDGISNAKVTITRIKPRNIIACEEVDELDMLERMYAKPSDLVSRKTLIGAIEKCGEDKIYPQALVETIKALPSAEPGKLFKEFYEQGKYDAEVERAFAEPSVSTNSDDLIIKNGKGIQDGLYNIKDGEIFKYKAKGGTVRAYKLVPSADRPTVIRAKTFMPTKDFNEWAKRIREVNPNAVVIPCDAEVVSADRPTLKQTDTLIIADALRYLVQDTERHEADRTRAEELRKQILQYGASMCHSADRPKGEWIEVFDFVHLAWECSKCGAITSVMTPFCYECGADMRPEK